MANFFQILETVLKKDTRFFSKDTNALLRNKVYESAVNMDAALIKLLLSNEETKKRFFTDVDGILIFDKVAFGWAVNNYQFLPDSYTRFKNRIGLADSNGDLISASNDVVLSFPYKDCVLEGGQTKEDQKRDEVFYNAVLAPDEVDRLLYPKVLVNAKRYTQKGAEEGITFKDDDNLIIKGNNLLAISSLLKRFEGKIKCIYIDPPYNTGGDSFGYNDRFNHSSWLTFMKNRLEISKKMLSSEGGIFVHIDYHELGYLLPLMDEIFGKENCIQIITVKTSSPAGFKTVNPGPIEVTEYVLFYTRQKDKFNFKKIFVPTEYDGNYDLYIENIEDNPQNWRLEKLYNVIYKLNDIKIGTTWQQSAKNAKEKWGNYWKVIRDQQIAEFALKNADKIVSVRDPQDPSTGLKALLEQSKTERDQIFVYSSTDRTEDGYVLNGGALSFYSSKVKTIDGVLTSTELLTDLWTDISWDGIAKEGGVTLKKGKKPEKLIRRIIEITTDNNRDIFLDFFSGSGTTCAVAHKMRMRYIGIEQLNYLNNDSIVRLSNVINGDNSGISKNINWQGGGSFVYCELAKCNQHFVDKALAVKNDKEAASLLEDVLKTGFISHKIFPKDISEAADDFAELALEDKKRFILELLDKNMLYVNLCDMNDNDFLINEADKKFTKSFYNTEDK